MGESQSRYSIVERLTQRKLDIIKSRSGIDSDVIEAAGRNRKKVICHWTTDQ